MPALRVLWYNQNPMKTFLSLLLIPASVLALSYEADTLPYTDAPQDLPTRVAIGTLTDLGIVKGHPDGTFKSGVTMNRAEFMRIAMGLLERGTDTINTRCFPDVDPNIWFAEDVCRAKQLGIVSGNAIEGVDPSLWPFEPTRSVKYEEALKILSGIYNIPLLTVDGEWYEKYVQSAVHHTISLEDAAVNSALTRGQMARLTVAFIAFNNGELDELRYAQTHTSSSVRTVFSAPSSSSSISSVSSTSSVSSVSSSSISSTTYDPFINDTSVDGGVLTLGTTTRILGSASIFPNAEPLLVEQFLIDLVAANSSLSALNVYDHDGALIGRATLDTSFSGNTRYKLTTFSREIIIPKRETYSFYVRGILKAQDEGGSSGGSIQIDKMGVTGTGVWSSRDYQQWTDSSEVFAPSSVARSAITEIRNAGDATGLLVPGTDIEIGSFYIAGTTGHAGATLKITAIDFTLGATGGTTVTNPVLRVAGSPDTHTCSIASSTITCSSLPDAFGKIDNGSRTLRLYGDVSIPADSQSARLQASINDPGTISSAGDITWTDGVTTFTWIDSGTSPLARGTSYSY